MKIRLGVVHSAAAALVVAAALAPSPLMERTPQPERAARRGEAPRLPEPYGPRSNRQERRAQQRAARKATRRHK